MQLALDHFTLELEAFVCLAVHSVPPPRGKRVDTWAAMIIAHLPSDALGLLVETALGPPPLRAVDHFPALPTAKQVVAAIELADPAPA